MSKKPPSLEGRLARLEVLEEAAAKERHENSQKLDSLMARFDKYEARWGGVVMIVSALVALAIALKDEIKRLFHG